MPEEGKEPRYRLLGVVPREIEVRKKQEPEEDVCTWPHFLVPRVVLLFLVAVPFLDRSKGWRIRDRKMVVVVFTVLAVAALVLTLIGAVFRGPGWSWVWPWQHLYLEL